MTTRVCTKCDEEKLLTKEEFSVRPNGTFVTECKKCRAKNSRQWRETNAAAHNSKRKEKHKADPRARMLGEAKRRAKAKGLEFSLTIDDIIVPEFCPVLDIPLYVDGGQQSSNSPSLDRLIPELGYAPQNVTVISLKANAAKGDLTSEELFKLAQWVQNMGG